MGIDIASALHSYCVEVESTKPIEAEKVSFGTIAESLQKGELTPLGPRLVRSEARSRLLAYYSDSPYSESWRAMGFGAQFRRGLRSSPGAGAQVMRWDMGMPSWVMMLMTLQPAAASVFCVDRVRAWRRRPIRVL